MSTLLTTATAVEDNVLDTMQMAEDVVVRTARIFAEGFEPITSLGPELPLGGFVPAPAEVVDHSFVFINRLLANLRDFTDRLTEVLPIRYEAASPRAVKASAKAQAA
jgi:hypothetical protein